MKAGSAGAANSSGSLTAPIRCAPLQHLLSNDETKGLLCQAPHLTGPSRPRAGLLRQTPTGPGPGTRRAATRGTRLHRHPGTAHPSQLRPPGDPIFTLEQAGVRTRLHVLVVCDNEGYAVIERLQVGQGGGLYNNMLSDARGPGSSVRVDFHAHAQALGALTFTVGDMDELREALAAVRAADRTTAIATKVRASDWKPGGAFWEVGVPTTSDRPEVTAAWAAMDAGLANQRRGI